MKSSLLEFLDRLLNLSSLRLRFYYFYSNLNYVLIEYCRISNAIIFLLRRYPSVYGCPLKPPMVTHFEARELAGWGMLVDREGLHTEVPGQFTDGEDVVFFVHVLLLLYGLLCLIAISLEKKNFGLGRLWSRNGDSIVWLIFCQWIISKF